MFTAYLDDSGTHDDTGGSEGSEVAVAAGYIGHQSEWEAFEARWNSLLTQRSLPYYHAVDCAHGTGHFKTWSVPERNQLHQECVEAITSHKLMPVGSAIATAEFRRSYNQRVPEVNRVRGAGFYQAVWNTFQAIGFFMLHTAPGSNVRLVLEHSPRRSEVILSAYDAAMGQPAWQQIARFFAGPPLFREKPGNPQLQAADVLAYEMGIKLRRQFGWQKARRRRSWEALAEHARQQAKSAGLEWTLLRFKES